MLRFSMIQPNRNGGSIPTDKTCTDFLSFSLHYNGKFHDGSNLIHYQEGKKENGYPLARESKNY